MLSYWQINASKLVPNSSRKSLIKALCGLYPQNINHLRFLKLISMNIPSLVKLVFKGLDIMPSLTNISKPPVLSVLSRL